jgi:hypothetical protein
VPAEDPARKATTPVRSAIATNHVRTKAKAFARALPLRSMRTTATTGNGLTITPTATGSD